MKRAGVMGLVLGGFLIASGAQASTIDTFEVDQAKTRLVRGATTDEPNHLFGCDDTMLPCTTGIGGADVMSWTQKEGPIIGGSREFQLTIYAFTADAAPDAEASKSVSGGRLRLSNDDGVDGSLKVVWDGTNDGVFNNTGLGGLDLLASAGKNGRFIFDDVVTDHELEVKLTVCREGTGACYTDILHKPILTHMDFSHDFSGFIAGTGLSPMDFMDLFSNVGAIMIEIRRDDNPAGSQALGGIDLNFAGLHTNHVPEPGTVSLLGIGVVGLGVAGFLRRRRQQ